MVTEERLPMAAATSAPSTGLERPSAKDGAESTSSIVNSASPGGDERGVANSSSNYIRLIFSFVNVFITIAYPRRLQFPW